MNNKLFRKKNMEKVASPEQLNDYIHVSNPSAWIVLAAFVILLVGICVWGIFGTLDTTLSVVAVKTENGVVCYVREADCAKISVGMTVEIGNDEFTVVGIEKTPVPVDESISDYAKHIGGLTDGEWIYFVYIDCPTDFEGNVFPAEIIIERIHPFYFVIN
jgi:hypothetical protein